ncbi:MAG TPA: hypothetical protein DDZ68_13370 [Parvularcula sp.]|nr:hypothetical protein [Parvularcula sp.]
MSFAPPALQGAAALKSPVWRAIRGNSSSGRACVEKNPLNFIQSGRMSAPLFQKKTGGPGALEWPLKKRCLYCPANPHFAAGTRGKRRKFASRASRKGAFYAARSANWPYFRKRAR